MPLLEGLTYLCHLYAHVKIIIIKGVVKVMKQIWTCNLHLLMLIVMSRVMSPVEQVPLIEHPLPDGSQMLFVLFYTFIMMIQPSLKVTVNPDLLCHLMGTPEHYEKELLIDAGSKHNVHSVQFRWPEAQRMKKEWIILPCSRSLKNTNVNMLTHRYIPISLLPKVNCLST